MFNKRSIVIPILILAVAVGGGFIWYWKYGGPQSHQVIGVLKSMEGNQLIVFGTHVEDANSETARFSLRHDNQDFTVVIYSNTKLVKTVWRIPVSQESWSKDRTKYDLATIQKEQQAGSVDDFKNTGGIPMTVKTANNSINETTLKAIEIGYISYSYAK